MKKISLMNLLEKKKKQKEQLRWIKNKMNNSVC